MTAPRRWSPAPKQPRQLDAGPLEPLIGSFALHLAAEGKAARTVAGYTSAVRWFAVGYLGDKPGKTSWGQVDAQDIQQWMITVGFDTPVRRTISLVPVPSPASSTIRARWASPARIDGERTHEASTSRSRGGTSTFTVNAMNHRPRTITGGQDSSLTGH